VLEEIALLVLNIIWTFIINLLKNQMCYLCVGFFFAWNLTVVVCFCCRFRSTSLTPWQNEI